MKVALFLLAVFGLSQGAVIPQPKALSDDLQDFIDLIPTEEILNIVLENLEDPEVQAVFAFIFGPEFSGLVVEVEAIPEYEDVISYLENAGLPVRSWVAFLHELLGIARSSPAVPQTKSLNGVIDQVRAILPIQEIKDLYISKLSTSPAFKELIEKIDSPTFRGFVQALVDNAKIQDISARLKALGVDIDGLLALLKDIFGFNYLVSYGAQRDLYGDFQDFLALIPTDEILTIILENLEDPEVQAVFAFIFGPEFAALVVEVEAIPEYDAVISYLEGAGLPVKSWIAFLHELLGIALSRPAVPQTKSLNGVIDQVRAILPIQEIKDLYISKLSTSPAFKELIEKIDSPTFRGFVQALVDNAKIQDISARLKALGVDIDGLLALLKDIFGFNYLVSYGAQRDLYGDFQDFLALIPTDEILTIILENLEDPEVQAVFAFIFGPEFAALVVEVEAIPEYDAVISYLEGAGLPVKSWIAFLHELLGIALSRPAVPQTKSLNGVIDQVRAILPIQEIKDLYISKLSTSPAFKELIEKIDSPTFRGFVQALVDNAKIQDISARLKALGVDIDGFLALLKDIFGFNYLVSYGAQRDLYGDLQDFLALIPIEEIERIVLENLEDPEVQAVIAFIFGPEIVALIVEVEAIPEYEAVISYLEGAGLPVRSWIAFIHELFGVALSRPAVPQTKSLNGVIDQVRAILPIQEIKDLYISKLSTSPAFKELIEKIDSPTFRGFVQALVDNAIIQDISARLKALGVDIDGFLALLKDIFGFNYLVSYGAQRDLYGDLQDFLALIPIEEIERIVLENLEDPEVQAVIAFIFGPEIVALIVEVEAIPEYEAVISYLEGAGLPVRSWIAFIHELFGVALSRPAVPQTKSLNGVIDQVRAILPIQEIKDLYISKLSTSPAFKELIEKIDSPTFRGFVQALVDNAIIRDISARLKALGVDIDGFLALLKDIFGFNY